MTSYILSIEVLVSAERAKMTANPSQLIKAEWSYLVHRQKACKKTTSASGEFSNSSTKTPSLSKILPNSSQLQQRHSSSN